MDQVTARKVASPKVRISVSSLPFESVPGQSRLFLDYLKDPAALHKFYPNAPRQTADLAAFVPEVIGGYSTDRAALCDALQNINVNAGAGTRAIENIDLLRDPSCVAVVTGQQAGLFTGPLYTIYKALSAIRLAEQLNEEEIKAVPVFWAATEDHDLEEISIASFLDRANELVNAKLGAENTGRSVGGIHLPASVEKLTADLFDSLPGTEFSAEAKACVTTKWSTDRTIGSSFLRTIAAIFQQYGLIVLDPQDAGIKRLCSPIYADAIEQGDVIVDSLVVRSLELTAAGYHAQVAIESDHFPLFWHDADEKRLTLRKVGDRLYRAKGTKRELSTDDLVSLARHQPDRLSPGVMLRPVVQDYLLPTLCYFGGAAEIAYFAQNSKVYRILKRPVTPILHRQSFTIVEKKQRKILDRFALGLEDLFSGLDALSQRVAAEQISKDSAKLFAEVEEIIDTEMDRLHKHISKIDPTVAANLSKRRKRISYHIAALQRKTLLASVRHDGDAARQIAGLFAALLPNGALQERSLNYFNFYNKFGPHFIDWLYEAVDLEDKGHRVVDL